MLSLLNFLIIQYRLLIEPVAFLHALFPRLLYWLVFVAAAYPPIAVLVGWWDYRRGAVPVETALMARSNPYSQAIAEAIYLLAENRPEEARRVLEPWVRRRG